MFIYFNLINSMNILEKLFDHTYYGLLVSSLATRFLLIHDISPYKVCEIRIRISNKYLIYLVNDNSLDFHPIEVRANQFYSIPPNFLFQITDLEPLAPVSSH